jgi:PGAP1-like protein
VTTVSDPGELGDSSGPGALRVRGGAGGVSARLADLERVGAQLRAFAGDLGDQGRVVLGLCVDPGLQLTAPRSPVTFAHAEGALLAAALGPHGLLAAATSVQLVGAGALAVASAYRAADAAAAQALTLGATLTGRAVGASVGPLLPGLGGALALVSVVGPDDLRRGRGLPEPLRRLGGLTLQLLAEHGAATEAVLPIVPGVLGGLTAGVGATGLVPLGPSAGPASIADVAVGLGVVGAATGVVTGTAPWFRENGEVRLRSRPSPRRRLPAGAGELLDRIPASSSAQIHVERVDGPSGRRWVVSVPGTSDWSPVAGPNPFDLTGNVRLMAGERTAAMRAVAVALRDSGVRRDEPVLLVGHSQGGLIAAALAADPSVRSRFRISHVLTSGAPVASVPVPDDVQVLSIEHTDDLVPRLDASANHDRPNWITVTAAAADGELPPAERAQPLAAHRLELYRHTAERIDRSADPSLVAWRDGLAPFLAGAGRSGVGWNVEVSRVGTA